MKRTLNCIVLCFLGTILNAQDWIQSSGITSKVITMMVYNADTLLAGGSNQGIYISYDNGINWEQYVLSGQSVISMVKVGDYIIAGTNGNDVYRSTLTNVSSQWEHIEIDNLRVYRLKLHNDTLFACTAGTAGPGALYFSTDTGETWTQFATIPPYAYLDVEFNSQGRTFVATPEGAYYTDNQSPWIETDGYGTTVRTINYIGNDSLVYGCDLGVFISSNNGVSVHQLPEFYGGHVYYLSDTFYLATLGHGFYYTNNIGSTWTNLQLNVDVHSLLNVDGKLIAGTTTGVFIHPGIPTNINDNKILPNSIQLYPNPVNDVLYFNNLSAEVRNIDIYDVTGKLMMSVKDKNEVDVSTLEAGIYFYKIYSSDEIIQTGKIIIE